MIHRLSHAGVASLVALTLATACGVTLLASHALSAQARPVVHAAGAKAATARIVNKDFGSDGARGSFSARLGSTAHVVAALMSLVTGVPYAEIAKGGTYVAKIASSSKAGLAVVTFSDHALGKVCVQWSGTSGKYNPSVGYLPVDGSLKIVGGTGAAARWKGHLTFKQTGLTGTDTLVFNTLLGASSGGSHGLTAACKAVTKLKG